VACPGIFLCLGTLLFMAALRSRYGHYIFALWFALSLFFFLFPRLISAVAVGCLPYFHTWCGLSANLRCRSETCCTRLGKNTVHKKLPKIRHLRTIGQLCRAISSQLKHISTIEKKLFMQQYLLHISSQYGELQPTSSSDRLVSLGHPQLTSTGFASWQRYCTTL